MISSDGIGPHYYDSLDKSGDCDPVIRLPIRDLVEMVVEMNRGTHRFLSHLVDVRRERLADRVRHYRATGVDDVAADVERRGDELADRIEALLKEGYY